MVDGVVCIYVFQGFEGKPKSLFFQRYEGCDGFPHDPSLGAIQALRKAV